MNTGLLRYYPHRALVETDQPLTIQQPNSILHAVGLQAKINEKKIELLSIDASTTTPAKK